MKKETKLIGQYPVDSELLKEITDFQNIEQHRHPYSGLSESYTILMKYNPDHPGTVFPSSFSNSKKLFQKIKPILDLTQSLYGLSYCSRAIITKLPAKATIQKHIDPGWLFNFEKRFHWVIQTNQKCLMNVANRDYHFEESQIWEFDNQSEHSVHNLGETDRWHLIFDLFMVESAIGQTPTPFEKKSFNERFYNFVLRKKKRART